MPDAHILGQFSAEPIGANCPSLHPRTADTQRELTQDSHCPTYSILTTFNTECGIRIVTLESPIVPKHMCPLQEPVRIDGCIQPRLHPRHNIGPVIYEQQTSSLVRPPH